MENITHSLVGATLAELALPADATPAQRRAFFVAGVLAANLPDADLVYTWITPAPLGSLLHHRGHTHTVAGLAALALLMGAVAFVPALGRQLGALRGRWWSLIAVGLVSHLVLDSWNSYGVHPFWPFSARWLYGDSIFIADPWLWILLGVPAALDARNRAWGIGLGGVLGVVVAAAAWRGAIPLAGGCALGVGAFAIVMLLRRRPPRRRAGIAMALAAVYVACMFGLRERVHARALDALAASAEGGRVLDVVLSPEPANPLCWSALAIAVDANGAGYRTTRGRAAPFAARGCGSGQASVVRWEDTQRHSLSELRDAFARDCSVRAWMQFGRAPELADGAIGDLRYGGARQGFSRMALAPEAARRGCPANLPDWGRPRADLLGMASGVTTTP